jgi:hypothetical protein
MNRFRTLLPCVLTVTAGLSAQTLSADVVRNNNDTVTYTFNIYGPPNGMAFPYLSPYLSISPLPLNPFGTLYIDPLSMISLGTLPLPGTGFGTLPITVPPPVTNGLFLSMQAVCLDTNLNVRLTQNWGGVLHHELGRDVPESLAWSTDGGRAARVQFQGSSRFHRIIWRDATGAVLGQCNLETTLAGNKTPVGNCGLVRPLRKGDTYETWESGDGQQWTPNRSPRPLP